MQNNAYLYIILVSLLVGLGSVFYSYNQQKKTAQQHTRNLAQAKDLEKQWEDISKREENLTSLRRNRLNLYVKTRKLASQVISTQRSRGRLSSHKEWFKGEELAQISQGGIIADIQAETKDQLQDQQDIVDRVIEQTGQYFAQTAKILESKVNTLDGEEHFEKKKHIEKANRLGTKVGTLELEIGRDRRVVPDYWSRPEPVGEVLQSFPVENKIILNLGRKDNISQNYKFRVFSLSPGGDRIDKGLIVVKEVQDLISVGQLISKSNKVLPPVRGDKIGSPAYTKKGYTFYLAGQFPLKVKKGRHLPSKFSKEELTYYLKKMGNRVAEELDRSVDFVVQGRFAEKQVQNATSLGIRIIRENSLVPFLGE